MSSDDAGSRQRGSARGAACATRSVRHGWLVLPLMVAVGPVAMAKGPQVDAAAGPAQARLGLAASARPDRSPLPNGTTAGVRIDEVLPQSPAADAGLRAGDILVSVNGATVQTPAQLDLLARRLCAPSRPSAVICRDDGCLTVELSLDPRTQPVKCFDQQLRELTDLVLGGGPSAFLGLRVYPMTEGLRTQYGVPDGLGLFVAEVSPGSPSATAGLRAGDVLTKLDERPMRTLVDLHALMRDAAPGAALAAEVYRAGAAHTLMVTPASPQPATPGLEPMLVLPFGPWHLPQGQF